MTAENEAGIGQFSEISYPVVCRNPVLPPDEPGIPTVTDSTSTSVSLKWSSPEDDGGAEIEGYEVEMCCESGDDEEKEEEWVSCNHSSGVKTSCCTVSGLEVL